MLGLRKDKYGYTWSFAGDGTPWWLALHVDPDSVDITDDASADPPGVEIPGIEAEAV